MSNNTTGAAVLLHEALHHLKSYQQVCEALELLRLGVYADGQLADTCEAVIEPAFAAIENEVDNWEKKVGRLIPSLETSGDSTMENSGPEQ